MSLSSVVGFLADRLGESGTYATFTAILGVSGLTVSPGVMQDVMFIGMALSAVAGVMLKEGVSQALSSGDALSALEARIAALEAGQTKS